MKLDLALQGGGAHGAFTWGVLDRLLDEPNLELGRISGTSAGALNGAALASGYLEDGPAGAKRSLADLWRKVGEAGLLMSLLLLPLRKPSLGIWDDALPLFSPYQTNPMGMAPLRGILESVVDLAALRSPAAPALFVNAVQVRSGLSRVFKPAEMSFDAILASACAPLMFQAVQIDGEPYWDGSYAGNPMLWPLYEGRQEADIFLIELAPPVRDELPTTAKNILNRINEIASINALVSELQTLDRFNRTIPGAALRLHVLSLPEEATGAQNEPSIKRTVALELFESLRRRGHAACAQWLDRHRDAIGVRSSVDIESKYLGSRRQG